MLKHTYDDYFMINKNITFNSLLLDNLITAIKSSASRKDDNLAMASALMTLNLFASREVVTPTNSSMIMYLIILAPTGYGKDRFLKAPSNILMSSEQSGINIRMSISSVPALEKAFTISSVVYNQIDEIGNLFYRLTKSKASNVEFALDYYLKNKWGIEISDIDVTTETKDREAILIKYPILNIYGASTPEQLYGSLNKRALCDGFYNRFLIVEHSKMARNREKVTLKLSKSIIEGLAKFNSLSSESLFKYERIIPEFKVPWFNTEVEARFFAFEDEIELIQEESVDLHKLFVRLPEMALRIATLIAVSRDFQKAAVTMDDLNYAINFVKQSGNISVKYTQTLMTENAFDSMRSRILALIESTSIKGINGRDISRRLNVNRNLRNKAIEDLIDFDLIFSKLVTIPSTKNKGKIEKTTMYYSNSDIVRNLLNKKKNELK